MFYLHICMWTASVLVPMEQKGGSDLWKLELWMDMSHNVDTEI